MHIDARTKIEGEKVMRNRNDSRSDWVCVFTILKDICPWNEMINVNLVFNLYLFFNRYKLKIE